MHALGIIDAQNDFMNPDGHLYVEGSELTIPCLAQLVDAAAMFGIPTFFTKDRHVESDKELSRNGGIYPDHCMVGTLGAVIIKEVSVGLNIVFPKSSTNVFDSNRVSIEAWLDTNRIHHVVLAGVVGNICVHEAALGFRDLGIKVTIASHAVTWMDINSTNNEETSKVKLRRAGVVFW